MKHDKLIIKKNRDARRPCSVSNKWRVKIRSRARDRKPRGIRRMTLIQRRNNVVGCGHVPDCVF